MAVIKKNTNNSRQGCGVKGIHLYCWWKCKFVQPLWKTVCWAGLSHSVMSDSLRPQELQPTRLLHPWGLSTQECWSGLPTLLQGIFPTQGLNPGLPHCRQILYHLGHQRSNMEVSQKTKNRIIIQPSNSTPGYVYKKPKDTCSPMFRISLFIIVNVWKQSKCTSTGKWIKKMSYMHTHIHTHTQMYTDNTQP